MRKLRIIDFDMECQPGHWIGGDYVSKVVTAIAWRYRDEKAYHVRTHYDTEPGVMAETLASKLLQADIITGHYIRGFDLPLLNGALLDAGLSPLPRLTTVDTKLDLNRAHGRSLSQKNLSGMLGVAAPKVDLTLSEWEGFNLRREGFRRKGEQRVVGDIKQHCELYDRLVELDWISSPKTWSPVSKGSSYRA